jgi:hypothetical protein
LGPEREALRDCLAARLAQAEKQAREQEAIFEQEEAEHRHHIDLERLRKAAKAKQKHRDLQGFKAVTPNQKLEFSLRYLGISRAELPGFLNYYVKGQK